MKEIIEYACIAFHDNLMDITELENHLSMNGYHFTIDRKKGLLFIFIEELSYVETILNDRNISYEVKTY